MATLFIVGKLDNNSWLMLEPAIIPRLSSATVAGTGIIFQLAEGLMSV
ncbi:hypothetical protein HK413_04580 [Mucilaginibacter sp. S1162]|uniref:Uncharacterized protein n=1 Tax=Mucilaginibacter humi TaxID=2732510 RepID=A0ABX1W3P2_9SPHI|nr:hypothetical protein [Mucilaginibacter humi]NNU33605.1 hypothetical protein [Mucilaginibacter humi]